MIRPREFLFAFSSVRTHARNRSVHRHWRGCVPCASNRMRPCALCLGPIRRRCRPLYAKQCHTHTCAHSLFSQAASPMLLRPSKHVGTPSTPTVFFGPLTVSRQSAQSNGHNTLPALRVRRRCVGRTSMGSGAPARRCIGPHAPDTTPCQWTTAMCITHGVCTQDPEAPARSSGTGSAASTIIVAADRVDAAMLESSQRLERGVVHVVHGRRRPRGCLQYILNAVSLLVRCLLPLPTSAGSPDMCVPPTSAQRLSSDTENEISVWPTP